jgi:hypothetical protein
LREQSLPVAHFFNRILVPAFGHAIVRIRGLEVGLAADALLCKRRGAIARQPGLVEHGLGLTHQCGLREVNGLVGALGGKAEPRAGLLQRGIGLRDPKLENDWGGQVPQISVSILFWVAVPLAAGVVRTVRRDVN